MGIRKNPIFLGVRKPVAAWSRFKYFTGRVRFNEEVSLADLLKTVQKAGSINKFKEKIFETRNSEIKRVRYWITDKIFPFKWEAKKK